MKHDSLVVEASFRMTSTEVHDVLALALKQKPNYFVPCSVMISQMEIKFKEQEGKLSHVT